MTLKVFTVFDSKISAYAQPFFMQTTGAAIRAWTETVNSKDTQFFKHPGDFTLFEIATYDDQSGKIESYETYINLGTALEAKNE